MILVIRSPRTAPNFSARSGGSAAVLFVPAGSEPPPVFNPAWAQGSNILLRTDPIV